MNATTRHFRHIVGDGAELARMFNGLASGEQIELTEGHYLPNVWPAVKRLAYLVNNSDFTVIGSGGDGKSGESTTVQTE